MLSQFRGIPGYSSVILERYARDADEEIASRMDSVVDACRGFLAELYRRQDREIGDADVRGELMGFLQKEHPGLPLSVRDRLAEEIANELRGFGPIHDVLKDPEVTDVVVVNYRRIVYEKAGRLYELDRCFRSEESLRTFIEKLCYLGRGRVDDSNPETSITVPSGPENYRVSIQIPPLTASATVSIRRFTAIKGLDELVRLGMYTPEAAEFLKACVRGRANIFFSGPMGTGKTTQIAVVGEHFAPDEMPVLVEEVRECPLKHPNLRTLTARPPNIEGKGEIKFARLMKAALQMRASRVLVAEVRDGAVFYMLQAMNIGHDGSMGTGHANNPRDLIFYRLPGMLRMAEETRGMDREDLLAYICSGIHLVVQLGRDGPRRVCTHISEVSLDPPGVNDIFVRRGGTLVRTGHEPRRLKAVLAGHGVRV